MRQIDLKEYETSAYLLSHAEASSLRNRPKELDLTVTRPLDSNDEYHLAPGSTVGALELDGLSILIQPKISIPQLLSMACYAIDKVKFKKEQFKYPDEPALPDVLARSLAACARKTFARGLLHDYRTEEEALHTVRGRIRFDEQIRRRFGSPLPIEVTYDDFTDDIPLNQLVKAAAFRLRRMRLRSAEARTGLAWVAAMLDNVSLKEFRPREVPKIRFDRLNERYRDVVALSSLVLQHSAFESNRGDVRTPGFLMDMNEVFQEFVTVAMREALGASDRMFGERSIDSLDEDGDIRLKPDLTWRDGKNCLFVGDAKYKKIEGHPQNADLYQLLAYVTALDLPGGMLIYAQHEGDSTIGESTGSPNGMPSYAQHEEKPAVHKVRRSGKRLEVAALNISGTLDDVLDRVKRLAERAKDLRDEARTLRNKAWQQQPAKSAAA